MIAQNNPHQLHVNMGRSLPIIFSFAQCNEFSVPIYCKNMKTVVNKKNQTLYSKHCITTRYVVVFQFGDCILELCVPDKTDWNDCDLVKLMKKIVHYHIIGIPECTVCLEACSDVSITVCSKCSNAVCLFFIQKMKHVVTVEYVLMQNISKNWCILPTVET